MVSALEAEPSPERCQLLLPLRKHISCSRRSSSERGWDSRDFAFESSCKKTSCLLLQLVPRGPRGALLPLDAFPSGYPALPGLVLPERTVRVQLSPANNGCMCFSSH